MSEVKRPNSRIEKETSQELPFVNGEVLKNAPDDDEVITVIKKQNRKKLSIPTTEAGKPKIEHQKYYLQYVVLPFIFLTAALLGGLRLSAPDNAFLFLTPPLVCLIFASILLILFFRANLIKLNGWFSDSFPPAKNLARGCVLLTLFFASTQIFNSLLPEKGLPFWTVAFCFFWTLWNNLFAAFDTKRLVQSLGGMFGLAFVVKYLLLAGLTAPASENWIQGIFANPTQEAFTWLLDLPKFSSATGYIQFFALVFYLIGLFLLKPDFVEGDR